MLSRHATAQEPGGVHAELPQAEVRLETELRDDTRTDSNGTVFDQQELIFREVLGFDFLADVYHPNLLAIDGDIDLQLEQHDRSSDTGTASDSDNFNALFSIDAEILREKSVSPRLYAWRRRIETRQTLFATSIADVQEYGADVRFRDLPIPSTAHYDHYTYDGSFDDTRQETWDRFRIDGTHSDDTTDVDYLFAYHDVALLNLDRFYSEVIARMNAAQRFGSKRRSYARLFGYYREQSGDVESLTARGTGTVRLQWLDSLYSDHGLIAQRTRFGTVSTSEQDTIEANSSLWHRLYSSLDSGLIGRVYRSEAGERTTSRVEGSGVLDYRKTTFFGSLNLHYRPDLYVQDETGAASTTPVVGEPHVYELGSPIFLNNFNVDLTSLAIWNEFRTVLYLDPTDYTVSENAGQVRIDVTPGSRILPGSTILCDYVYEPQPDREFRSVQQDVGVGLDFGDYLTTEFRYVTLDQDLLSGVDNGTLETMRSKFARVRLHQWDQEIGAEWEDRESNINPIERFSVWARSSVDIDDDLRLTGSFMGYRTAFDGYALDERGLLAGTSLHWQIGPMTEWYLRADYHKVDQRIDRGWGWLLESGFIHRFRKTSIEALVRYREDNFEVAPDEDILYAFLMVRRTF